MDKDTKCEYSFCNWNARNILVIKLSEFAEFFIYSTPAPVVSILEDRYILRNVIINMTSCTLMHDDDKEKEICYFKIVYNKRKLQILGMNLAKQKQKKHIHFTSLHKTNVIFILIFYITVYYSLDYRT